MRLAFRPFLVLPAALMLCLLAVRPAASQCVSLTTLGSPYTQNFDTLANTGTSTLVPLGWAFSEALANANTTYTAGTGSGTAGDTYSFGGAASSERAFGGLQSGTLNPTIGACFTNNTGVTVSNLTIAYIGEEWRLGTAARTDQLDFEYSLNAASLTTGTWTAVNALDFITPNTVAPLGAKDGNNASFRTAISSSISPLSIANGATFWIRWLDFNASGADDGLAVDDFSLTPSVIDTAPSVLTTSPPNGATGVGLAANVTVTFSEPVNVALGWFTISCTVSGLHAATVSGGPTTFTLDPTANFVANEICTVTIDDVFVSDQDANDPPDNMAADFVWSFDTNPPPLLVVNEIDYDQAGTDAAEFLEIRNNGPAPVNLDPVVVELINGNLGGATPYAPSPIDLPNVMLAPGAYFVVCANNTTTPNCNLDVAPDTNLIQNGPPDAVALRWNGVLVDTVSYEGDTGAPYTETSGSGLEDDGTDDFIGISRFPDGTDTGVNNADLSERCITPGAANAAATAPCPPPAILGLAIDDVTLAEGQAGTRTFTFTVSLDQPAPGPGGVTFDIATADGTAQDDNPVSEDNDYVPQTLTGQNIPAGDTEYTFDVTVNSDTTPELDETFFVNVTNVTGAAVGDPQGLGTIQNDDFAAITLIHDIQGPGASSPEDGNVHTVHAIVTGVKFNGFFVQEEVADYDADPATSEGIFVFTSSAPPAAAQVGNLVYVTGTVSEFIPSADPLQPPLTELTFASTVLDATGFALPAAVPLTPAFPDPAGVFDQLERVEGMRVAVASLTVSGPTLGNTDEPNATSSSTGVFFGVVTGVPRPFREPGIQAPDPAPSGTIPPIPRFDSNPELLRVDGDGLAGAPLLDAGSSAVVTGLVGPLDYTFRRYTILPDPPPSAPPVAAGGPTATAASVPTGREFTVGAYNMERFFDTVNDPGVGEPVLTSTAFDNRLNKASLGIRNHLRTPDILGVVEIENLSTLQALAARISADAVAAAQPDPQYSAHLAEGNDIGGIDVGFLVKTAPVAGSTPRITVNAVVQENAGELFVNPDTTTSLLNDRPSLRLDAVVNHANGASFPVTVIVNHLRSLNDVNSTAPGSNGWATDGDRVRGKRQEQAESLANLVQARQTATPGERIILVGDFNAYEFNDGLVDSMNVISGTPPPDNQTAVPGDGVDLVTPDLDNLFDTPPAPERYSYIFDGQTQNIDHIVVNGALTAATTARRIEHPRINADFPAVDRNDSNTPRRLSDHDPVVGFFEVQGFAVADLSITKTDGVATAVPGGSVTYTVTASNAGPDPVTGATVADTFPAVLTCTWTCVGAGGGTCTAAGSGNISDTVNLPAGGSVTYTASCTIAASATGTLDNTATVSSAVSDPNPANNSATDTDTLTPQADLAITKTDGVTTATPGGSVTYTITASNAGPSNASGATVTDTFPASLTCTWTCVGAGGGTCTAAGSGNINDTVNLPVGGSVTYTASCTISLVATGSLSNTATVTAPGGVTDPNPGNNSATDTDTLGPAPSASVSGTKTVSGSFTIGGTVTYTVVLTNSGSGAQGDNPGDEFTDILPPELALVSATATSGTPAVNTGTNTVTWNGSIPAGGSVTITITATILPAAAGETVSNQGTIAYDADGNGTNEASAQTDDPGVAGSENPTSFFLGDGFDPEIPTLDTVGLVLLALLLALGGAWALRRKRSA